MQSSVLGPGDRATKSMDVSELATKVVEGFRVVVLFHLPNTSGTRTSMAVHVMVLRPGEVNVLK